MSDVLDSAANHFQNLKENNQILIDVPEWKCKLIARRGSVVQKEPFFIHYNKGEVLSAQIWLVIKRCLNEDETKAFPNEQSAFKKLSESADADVIVRIANEILEFDLAEEITTGDASKN